MLEAYNQKWCTLDRAIMLLISMRTLSWFFIPKKSLDLVYVISTTNNETIGENIERNGPSAIATNNFNKNVNGRVRFLYV